MSQPRFNEEAAVNSLLRLNEQLSKFHINSPDVAPLRNSVRKSISALTEDGYTLLHVVIDRFPDNNSIFALLKLLHDLGADFSWSFHVPSPLIYSISLNKPLTSAFLLTLSPSLLYEDSLPLMYAIKNRRWNCLAIMLETAGLRFLEDPVKNFLDLIHDRDVFHQMMNDDVDMDVFRSVCRHLLPIIDLSFDSEFGYPCSALFHAVIKSKEFYADSLIALDCDPIKIHRIFDEESGVEIFTSPLMASVSISPDFLIFSKLFEVCQHVLNKNDHGTLFLAATEAFGMNSTEILIILSYLLDQGVDVEFTEENSPSPLVNLIISSKESKESDVVAGLELLLQAGAETESVPDLSLNPLLQAVKYGNAVACRCLLDNGCDANVFLTLSEVDVSVPLLCFGTTMEIFEILLEYGANPNSIAFSTDKTDKQVLQILIKSKMMWAFNPYFAILFGTHISQSDDQKCKLIETITSMKEYQLFELLPITPLIIAIALGNFQCAQLLLTLGENPNTTVSSNEFKNLPVISDVFDLIEVMPYCQTNHQLTVLDILVIVSVLFNHDEESIKTTCQSLIGHPKTAPYTVEKAVSLAVYHQCYLIFDLLTSSDICYSPSRAWLLVPEFSSSPISPLAIAIHLNDSQLLSKMLTRGLEIKVNEDLPLLAAKQNSFELIKILADFQIEFTESAFYHCFDTANVVLAEKLYNIILKQIESGISFKNWSVDDIVDIKQRLSLALSAMVNTTRDLSPSKTQPLRKSIRTTKKGHKVSGVSPKAYSKTPLAVRLVPF
ncbi:hypothetical protein GEMRC1_009280 [Eukaryota sp. GEM-RC1]